MFSLTNQNKLKFYDLTDILKIKADYYMIYGERSNGKTVAVLKRIIDRYVESGSQGIYLRRNDVDIKGRVKDDVFGAVVHELDYVNKATKGEWTMVRSKGHQFFFARVDPDTNRVVLDIEPFCYAVALSQAEINKGRSYPKVGTVMFDEFLTQDRELKNEFGLFANVLSTIVRTRDNVEVFMLGNTVNMYSTYFESFNIMKQVRELKQGEIQKFILSNKHNKDEPATTVAVEYCTTVGKKKSNKYFNIDSSTMNMIKNGGWEFPQYPYLPDSYENYRPVDIVTNFYVHLADQVFQGNVVAVDDAIFVHVYPKTTYNRMKDKQEVKDALHYRLEPQPEHNCQVFLTRNNFNRLTSLISKLYAMQQFYYSDNKTGMAIKQYINNEPK